MCPDSGENTNVIVFDNLVSSTDVVGEFKPVKAVTPVAEPFVNPNAAGSPKAVEKLEDVKKRAASSGENLKKVFGS